MVWRAFTPESFTLHPDDDQPGELRIVCSESRLRLHRRSSAADRGCRRADLPSAAGFLIATVDKFAALPWVGTSGAASAAQTATTRPASTAQCEPGPRQAAASAAAAAGSHHPGRAAPDLGAARHDGGPVRDGDRRAVRARARRARRPAPKMVASTATVRRAQEQIQALFGRRDYEIFPPPGPDRRESFFARTRSRHESSGRRYVGVAAQGRNPKVVMLRGRTGADRAPPEAATEDNGGHNNAKNPADPYMTLRRVLQQPARAGRRAGGSSRTRSATRSAATASARGSVNTAGCSRTAETSTRSVELTSRVPTNKVAEARRRLGTPFDETGPGRLRIATNMISVGLDIPRLGLMVRARASRRPPPSTSRRPAASAAIRTRPGWS